MAGPQPLIKHKIVKKRQKRFIRHQSDRFMRVSESWRRPRGIDGVVRRGWRSTRLMPSIGYGTNKNFKHVLPNGFRKVRVFNVDDLEKLMMQNKHFCAEIARTVSVVKRKAIVQRAKELSIKVTNPTAKLTTEENE
jgi:large subunit ribosomal protein L32e